MGMRGKFILWAGGAGLCLHLLACGQQGNLPSGQTSPEKGKPAPVAKVQPQPQAQTQPVALTGRETRSEGADDFVPTENHRPQVVSVALEPAEEIHRGVDIRAIPTGQDPEGDEVGFRYQWVINGERVFLEEKPMLQGDKFKRGDRVTVHVTPFDQGGEGEMTRPVPMVIPNGSPRFISIPPMEFKSSTYTYQPVAKDPDDDPVTFSLANAPQGMTLDPETGKIVWPISRDQIGEHTIEVVAEDGEGGSATQKYTLAITFP